MVEAIVTATNSRDNSLRYWGLSVDQIPRGNWVKNKSIVSAAHDQRVPWVTDVPIPEGDHVVYFIVSQVDPSLGGYDGKIAIGGASFDIVSVDNDTVNGFEVTVKDGKVKNTRQSRSSLPTEVPENTPWDWNKVGRAIKGIPYWIADHKVMAGLIFGGTVGGGFAAYYVAKKMKKGKGF